MAAPTGFVESGERRGFSSLFARMHSQLLRQSQRRKIKQRMAIPLLRWKLL
jgi:hypothetical protein